MKDKKGFIFVETIVVLVVVALALSIALSSYSLVTRRTKINYYYNNPSDMFLLHYLFTMGTTSSNNYLTETQAKYVNAANCSTVLTQFATCKDVLSDFGVQYVGIIPNIKKALDDSSFANKLDGGIIEFINQLQKCTKSNTCTGTENVDYIPIPYAIGVFYRENEYHYAAIVIEK